jgi:magnesium and cobalt transporter
MHARDIMIPRTQMTVLKADDPFEETLNNIIQSAHSRYPVIGESMDEIIGILLAKDLLGVIFQQDLNLSSDQETASAASNDTAKDSEPVKLHQHDITTLLRPAVFVPESKRLNVLLKQFREDRNHMALVIDEYGTLAGLVTIEDVLEEIVGEIEDEHDAEDDALIRKLSNSNFIINALTPIDAFNDYFKTDFLDDEFDTIGGIVINKFGHLPKANEQISFAGFTFHVMRSDNRRLRTLRMSLNSKSNTSDAQSDSEHKDEE